MNELIQLCNFFTEKKIKSLNVLNQEENESLESKLFYSLTDGKIRTDEEACFLIYGNRNKSSKFRQLKYNLKKRLLNSILFIKTTGPKFPDRRKAYYELSRKYCQFAVLRNSYARKLAIPLGEKAVKKAIKFEHFEFASLFARDLMRHYGFQSPNLRKYRYYKKLLIDSMENLDAEFIADQYFTEVSRIFYIKKQTNTIEYKELLARYCSHLRLLQKHIQSFNFNQITCDLVVHEMLIKKEYKKALIYINEQSRVFTNKPFVSKYWVYTFNIAKAVCYINLREFRFSLQILKHNLTLIETGHHNWFILNNYIFICHILLNEFSKAQLVITKVLNHPNLKFEITHFELWKIKEAYLNFLISSGKLEIPDTDKNPPKKFRLYKFLNEVPYYSKDKYGVNVSILIIQVLFHIQRREFDKVVERIDSLKQYIYRYLKNEENIRANCFIRILTKLPDANYNSLRLKRYAKKYIDKIHDTSFTVTEQISEIEIIPFENLLEILMELLEHTKPKRMRSKSIKASN